MFTPTAQGDGFQQKYFDAIQSDPNVVMEHGELAGSRIGQLQGTNERQS